MKPKIIAALAFGCAASGLFAVSRVRAQNPAPIAHSQAEFNALAKTQGADLNALGNAFDNQSARLFWFSDLEKARIQAKKEGKPILSLRMLGKLSDEYSCANSRFFRTALYPNAQIGKILREKWILHWSSERPVPVVTIDMGDGRVLKRTLTGNSAHYVMDSSGAVLDVLPGLYGPGAFEKWLLNGGKLNADLSELAAEKRADALKKWHGTQLRAILERKIRVERLGIARLMSAESEKLLAEPLAAPVEKQIENQVQQAIKYAVLSDEKQTQLAFNLTNPYLETGYPTFVPTAEEASRITAEKRVAEFGLLTSTTPRGTKNYPSPLISRDERRAYGTLAASFLEDSRLDSNSRAFLLSKLPAKQREPLQKAQVQSINQIFGVVPSSPDQTVARFEDAMAFDTARNEAEFHTQVHALFARGEQGDFQSLNRKIYDRLFLTPQSDPWLGLLPDGVYNGLQNGGIGQTGATEKTASSE